VFLAILLFAGIAALLTITPGIDTALVLRSTITRGRRAGIITAWGICSGVVLWGVASGAGVAALLTASQPAFNALRLMGAAYVIFLGLRSIVGALHQRGSRDIDAPSPPNQRTLFANGLMTNLLNPKVGVFYVAVVPQFIPPGAPILPMAALLAGIHAVEGVLWLSLIAALAARTRWLVGRRVQRGMEVVTGTVLLGFGAKLAVERL